MAKIIYNGEKFQVSSDVYEPDEDTYLLLENLSIERGETFLEIGTGSGINSIVAAEKGGTGIATDISEKALDCAKKNAKNHGVEDKIEFRKGNLFAPIEKDEIFDLIIFNPPYLPIEEDEKLKTELSKAWDGGPTGREIIDEFLENFEKYLKKNGKILLLHSSLANKEKTLKKLEEKGFKVNIHEKKSFFENIFLFEGIRKK